MSFTGAQRLNQKALRSSCAPLLLKTLRSLVFIVGVLMLSLATAGCGGGGGSGSSPSGPAPGDPGDDGGDEGDGGDGGDDVGDEDACPSTSGSMFVDITDELGLCYESDEADYDLVPDEEGGSSFVLTSGGLSLVEMDDDGLLWLYITRGGGLAGQLFEYGSEQFHEIIDRRGITPTGHEHSAYFLDLDADGDKDFLSIQYLGIIEVFENDGTNQFSAVEDNMGLRSTRSTEGVTAGDFDLDGDLDLFFTHWGGSFAVERPMTEYLWRNAGDGTFRDFSDIVDLESFDEEGIVNEYTFTPIFTDLDSDGYPDLVVASDFGSSQVMMNKGGQFYENVTTDAIDDENGMGADVGDIDNDGDFDWFVSSISNSADTSGTDYGGGSGNLTGNRLYENTDGFGTFVDISDSGGVRDGYWGWGACLADFNNDGHLDIFHTNGFGEGQPDPSRLFMWTSRHTWTEESDERGITHDAQGRAVACTDFNDDGNVDIFIGNHAIAPTVYENTGDTDEDADNHYIKVRLEGLDDNPEGIGARIAVLTSTTTQVREMRNGGGFLTQRPKEVHFGLGEEEVIARVTVKWPRLDQTESVLTDVATDQILTIEEPEPIAPSLIVMHGEGSGLYTEGEVVEISAISTREHYFFSHWTASGDVEFADRFSATTTVVMPGDSVAIDANFLPGVSPDADVSPIRRWNEVLLQAIRLDFARPTVHARNLFHISAAMYDAWAAADEIASPWLLGREQADFACEFDIEMSDASEQATIEAASYAAYRLLLHRFEESPGVSYVKRDAESMMGFLGYDTEFDTREIDPDNPATLGNHIGWCYIEMGFLDAANEENLYANVHYEPVNESLDPNVFGNEQLEDYNRWQPLQLPTFIDQSGNRVNSSPEFIGAEWGKVWPFSLRDSDMIEYEREDGTYYVFHNPGTPPQHGSANEDLYQWGFSLVSTWSSHLDPDENVMWDISPATLGNINIDDMPKDFENFEDFYDKLDGGDTSKGYDTNPVTFEPYEPQEVPRGDYTRVLAEFWADGPQSETPPGHWFVILNTVNDHPALQRRLKGTGPELSMLEWDMKSYMILGGTMHDSAIAAWGAKGWYDYIRPISAIRGMAHLGQSSDPGDVSYDPGGLPLEPGFIEIVREGDELEGEEGEHVGRIKIWAWLGPTEVYDPQHDYAGVGWMLAEEWWPYQRPSFVSPPFAGYLSGHSTYSRAAADTLTRLTGDRYFPGGMSGFEVQKDKYLKFEKGPSIDLTLEWATYQDASDQCSLSRIWGGIHPPADDLPGRFLGEKIAVRANQVAFDLFEGIVEE